MVIFTVADMPDSEVKDIYEHILSNEPEDDNVIYYNYHEPSKAYSAVLEHIPLEQLIELNTFKPVLQACCMFTDINTETVTLSPYKSEIVITLNSQIIIDYVIGDYCTDDLMQMVIILPKDLKFTVNDNISSMHDLKSVIALAAAEYVDDPVLTTAIAQSFNRK